ncbi:hypothetical protein HAX54_024486 [Datura stramonium]|uniref:Uncharacterized protein n=1 Tax=Datura stramonium TaxID=4076 RepID=A0ABS8V108_DATST|nr:hypothetical protein [Datura stramonium]
MVPKRYGKRFDPAVSSSSWIRLVLHCCNPNVEVAQEIESEAKYQNDFINQLQMTLIKAQAGVKNNMRRLNRSIIQEDDLVGIGTPRQLDPTMHPDVSSLIDLPSSGELIDLHQHSLTILLEKIPLCCSYGP